MIEIDEGQLRRDLDNIVKKLKKLDKRVIEPAVIRGLKVCQTIVANKARQTKAFEDATGTLRGNIEPGGIERTSTGWAAYVDVNTDYAAMVELGCRPHWVPGYWEGGRGATRKFVYVPWDELKEKIRMAREGGDDATLKKIGRGGMPVSGVARPFLFPAARDSQGRILKAFINVLQQSLRGKVK